MTLDNMQFYLDILNGGDIKNSSANTSMASGGGIRLDENKSSTIRLYCMNGDGTGTSATLLMVAPYLSEYTFTASHQWESAGNTIAGAIARGKINAMSAINDLYKNWAAELEHWSSRFEAKQQYYEQLINAADSLKIFKGTNVDSGFDSIDVILLSDYKLITSITKNNISENTPLKDYLGFLIDKFIGDSSFGTKGVGSNQDHKHKDQGVSAATGTSEYTASAVGTILPPNGITITAQEFQTLVPKTYFAILGKQTIIKNLIPESFSITPSRMLTVKGDYYYARISVKFTNVRYQIKEDMQNWIGKASSTGANMQYGS